MCKISSCERSVLAKGLCRSHYDQERRGNEPGSIRSYGIPKVCSIDGCANDSFAKGYCRNHYDQITKTGKIRVLNEFCWVEGCGNAAPNDLCVKHRTYRSRLKATTEFIVELFSSQQCSICGNEDRRLDVDHDHQCCAGRAGTVGAVPIGCMNCVRGLICTNCNKALGLVNDDPEILKKMIVYLTAGG